MLRKFGYVVCILSLFLLCQLAFAAQSLTDEFNDGNLDSKWSWHNEPNKWDESSTKAGWLYINADTNRNLWTEDGASRLYQTIELNEFDVETHLHAVWDADSIVAGVVVKGPQEDNWVMLAWFFFGIVVTPGRDRIRLG